MKNKRFVYSAVTVSTVILLSACSPDKNPQLTACQNITQHLLAGQAPAWDAHTETATEEELRIDLTFTAGGGSMQSSCGFAADANDEYAAGGQEYDTSPTYVNLNGRQVDQRSLFEATVATTKKAIKDTAEHTVKKSKENLQKAEEMANQASEKTQEMMHQASDKAKELAGQASESARQATIDAADRVQKALEK